MPSATCALLALAFYLRYPASVSTTSVLRSRRPSVALEALWTTSEQSPVTWDGTVRDALLGKDVAVRAYVAFGKALMRSVLLIAHEVEPDVVDLVGDRILIIQAKRQSGVDALEVLELAIPDAPLSPWTTEFGLGPGTALALLARVRAAIPGGRPLPFPARSAGGLPELVADPARFERYRLLVWEALREDAASPLAELQTMFDLDNTETARLFGVTRQAIGDWLKRGVPADRTEKLVTMIQVGRFLGPRLRPGLLPGVARKPADAYGRRSMLEAMAAGDHEAVLDITRRSLDWSITA